MDKPLDIETKYQKLAAEFSKVRSQATVLKKALLEEQAKNAQLNEFVKIHEQTIRKHDQEMESLTFRNEQLTKRISVLQQDLQENHHTGGKKIKNKHSEVSSSNNVALVNEELQKKILENAQLFSSMADKNSELSESKEKISWLENTMQELNKKINLLQLCSNEEPTKLKKTTTEYNETNNSNFINNCDRVKNQDNEKLIEQLQLEIERLKNENVALQSKRTLHSNSQLSDYYESQITLLTDSKLLALSETRSLWAENGALQSRLDQLTLDHASVEHNLERSYEELITTNDNYKCQLDAMTEHLAAQNEKITNQCDEIQLLKHMLSAKK